MRTRVRGNQATAGGRGDRHAGGSVLIIRSRVTGNRAEDAGGGVAVRVTPFASARPPWPTTSPRPTRAASTLSRRTGRITESTIDRNAAHRSGGGVYQSASNLAVFNTTITRNRADSTGGGIQSSVAGGHVMLNSVTVVRNVADLLGRRALGGGLMSRGGSFGVVNSIVALNRSDATPNDCHGAFDSFGGNLLSTIDGCRGFAGSALVGLDPKLGRSRTTAVPPRLWHCGGTAPRSAAPTTSASRRPTSVAAAAGSTRTSVRSSACPSQDLAPGGPCRSGLGRGLTAGRSPV